MGYGKCSFTNKRTREGDVQQQHVGNGDDRCSSTLDIQSEWKVLVKEWSSKEWSPAAKNIQLFASFSKFRHD